MTTPQDLSRPKTRGACTDCINNKTKCDERDPPCSACCMRYSDCSYPDRSMPDPPSPEVALPIRSLSIHSPPDRSLPPRKAKLPLKRHVPGKRVWSSGSRSTDVETPVFDFGRKIELELMMRWATSTYRSVCMRPEDLPWFRSELPRLGFEKEFLLYGILALSALHIAVCGDPLVTDGRELYFHAAMQYWDFAARAYRTDLPKNYEGKLETLILFSAAAAPINMAIAEYEWLFNSNVSQSLLGRMSKMFRLLRFTSSIIDDPNKMKMMAGLETQKTRLKTSFETSPTILTIWKYLKASPNEELPLDIEIALLMVDDVIDQAIPIPKGDGTARKKARARVQCYRTLVSALRKYYVEDPKDKITGLSIIFPSVSGPDFADEIQREEPMALLILMHWGVLLHHLSPHVWWAKTIGKRLVFEISDKLIEEQSNTELGQIREWHGSIEWVRSQVSSNE